jgi:hypothetical protein
MPQHTASPDPRADGDRNEPANRPADDVEHGTGQAGADGERERIEGTPNPGPDSIPTPGGATPGTTAGA